MVHIILIADTLQTIHRTRNGLFAVSRFRILVLKDDETDEEGAIGYDRPMTSFFFQGFVNQEPES